MLTREFAFVYIFIVRRKCTRCTYNVSNCNQVSIELKQFSMTTKRFFVDFLLDYPIQRLAKTNFPQAANRSAQIRAVCRFSRKHICRIYMCIRNEVWNWCEKKFICLTLCTTEFRIEWNAWFCWLLTFPPTTIGNRAVYVRVLRKHLIKYKSLEKISSRNKTEQLFFVWQQQTAYTCIGNRFCMGCAKDKN